jgi:hypothetical protein
MWASIDSARGYVRGTKGLKVQKRRIRNGDSTTAAISAFLVEIGTVEQLGR